jgi:hypothetical protein
VETAAEKAKRRLREGGVEGLCKQLEVAYFDLREIGSACAEALGYPRVPVEAATGCIPGFDVGAMKAKDLVFELVAKVKRP